VAPDARAEGPEGVGAVLELLDGYEVPAGAWEADVLPARLGEYDPLWLDGLCLSGEIAWGRLSPAASSNGHKSGPIRTTPIALFRRERGAVWRSLTVQPDPASLPLSHSARAVLEALDQRGASFFGDLVNATGLLRTEVEKGLGELVAWGLVSSDSFAGLRALLVPSDRRRPIGGFRRRGHIAPFGVEAVGLRRSVRGEEPRGELVAVSGADPLNLVGIVTPGDVVAGVATNRILYRDGIPVALKEGAGSGERYLAEVAPDERERLKSALVRGRVAPLVRTYLGRSRPRPAATPD